MVVVHNCLKVSKNDIDFNDLKKVIKNHILSIQIYISCYKLQ
jgi:hypothetical protein